MVVTLEHTADTGSNQPGKVGVQLIAMAYSYKRPSGFTVSVLKPKIDRLSLTFDIQGELTRKKVRDHLHSQALNDSPIVTPWKKHKDWGASKYSRSYSLSVGGENAVLLQHAALKANHRFLRFEFNPYHVGPDGVEVFRTHLLKITGGLVTYESLAFGGKVTRLDIAIDLVNIDLEDLLISTSKPGVTSGYFNPSGKAETKYLNVNTKGSNLYVYDRKAKLLKDLEKGSVDALEFGETKLTRVEVRTSTEKPLAELSSLTNRLKKIDLIDIEAVEPPEEEHHWKMFQDSCRYRGLAGALSQLPNSLSAKYEDAITSASGQLWKPETLWGTWPQVVEGSGLLP